MHYIFLVVEKNLLLFVEFGWVLSNLIELLLINAEYHEVDYHNIDSVCCEDCFLLFQSSVVCFFHRLPFLILCCNLEGKIFVFSLTKAKLVFHFHILFIVIVGSLQKLIWKCSGPLFSHSAFFISEFQVVLVVSNYDFFNHIMVMIS